MSDSQSPRRGSSDDPTPKAAPPKDVVLVGGATDDGKGVGIVRLRQDRIEVGELREAKEGQPIVGELIRLAQRPEHERLYDVEVLAKGPLADRPLATESSKALPHKGPAKVSTEAYREGWELVFGRRSGDLPN